MMGIDAEREQLGAVFGRSQNQILDTTKNDALNGANRGALGKHHLYGGHSILEQSMKTHRLAIRARDDYVREIPWGLEASVLATHGWTLNRCSDSTACQAGDRKDGAATETSAKPVNPRTHRWFGSGIATKPGTYRHRCHNAASVHRRACRLDRSRP